MSDCDLLTKGDLIKSRWRITHKIGGGGFGQIYQAYDKFRRELVAVKVESNSQARQGIRMEVTVLRRIQNREHVCELLSGGTSTLYNYMIMTLLGSNLSELRRSLSEQCFTLSTTLRISLQILEAIQSVHSIGFLHRDIKPSNFAIGRKNIRQIFILDFGRPARIEAGFRGRFNLKLKSLDAYVFKELFDMHLLMHIIIEN
jgi:tau tubulin kinase